MNKALMLGSAAVAAALWITAPDLPAAQYVAAGAVALLLTLFLGEAVLPLLRRLKVGQSVREDGPQAHLVKNGTPTMGGVMFIPAMLIAVLLFADITAPALWLWVFSFLAYGLIGFADDYLKVVRHHNLGLNAKQKLLGQFVAAALLLIAAEQLFHRGTVLYLTPWLPLFDMGILFYPFTACLVVGMVNAVNLTDGLDGLASGVSVSVFAGFAVVTAKVVQLTGMLSVQLPDLRALPLAAAAGVGGCLGFLYFNRHPARVFMGDTGSLALGGSLAGIAVICRGEVLFLLFGMLYLLEACSVMLQVFSFKLRRKRIFRMAPLHHHYELGGWSELRVVYTFWAASAVFVAATLLLC